MNHLLKEVSVVINHRRRFAPLLMLCIASVVCVGCINVDVEVVVNPDGTGTVGFAAGIDAALAAMMALEEQEDPFGSMDDYDDWPEGAAVHRWVDDDIEWQQVTVPFSSLSELNELMGDFEGFVESFAVTKRSGLVKDYYEFEATLPALTSIMDLTEEDMWASSMLGVTLSVALPGEVTHHNGRQISGVGSSLNSLQWTFSTRSQTAAYARSEIVNRTRAYGLLAAAALLLLGCGIVLGAGILLIRRRSS